MWWQIFIAKFSIWQQFQHLSSPYLSWDKTSQKPLALIGLATPRYHLILAENKQSCGLRLGHRHLLAMVQPHEIGRAHV